MKIAVFVLLAGTVLYFLFQIFRYELALRVFRRLQKREFVIPGLAGGFIPQGIAFHEADGTFYVTGYYPNSKKASPIFIIDRNSGTLIQKIQMADRNGSPFTGHAGGIHVQDGKVLVAGSTDACLYVWDVNAIRSAAFDAALPYTSVIPLKAGADYMRVSFVSADRQGLIYVGEYHRAPAFPTYSGHRCRTAFGEQNALLLGFSLQNGSTVLQKAFSIPDHIQGVCFNEHFLYLSQSNGYGTSRILVYPAELASSGTLNILGRSVPLYVLDESSLLKTVPIPRMAEEIEFVDKRIYIMCEAASNRFRIGKFTGAKTVRSVDTHGLL